MGHQARIEVGRGQRGRHIAEIPSESSISPCVRARASIADRATPTASVVLPVSVSVRSEETASAACSP
ncbi:hypothetical protein [Streptomyces sp. NBC_01207]|uniref:hypothetical protein n=1 Tax=Streptomyces sp. NBC_01207 TaxID=2903772 RepID=UPI002E0D141B